MPYTGKYRIFICSVANHSLHPLFFILLCTEEEETISLLAFSAFFFLLLFPVPPFMKAYSAAAAAKEEEEESSTDSPFPTPLFVHPFFLPFLTTGKNIQGCSTQRRRGGKGGKEGGSF